MGLAVSLRLPSREIISPESSVVVALGLGFLPWIAAVLVTAGAWGALNFLAYALIAVAAGYSVICVALPAAKRTETLVLAPSTGILAISALTAFWVRLSLPIVWSPLLWLALAAVGARGLWRDRNGWARIAVPNVVALSLLSSVVCAVYFLPSAYNDMVRLGDGSFNWRTIDSQHFHALAASIKESGTPPKSPGTATAELLYHFGPYAPAAAISRVDGLDLEDALDRVTRGAALWALVLSSFGLGTLLSLRASGTRFGGCMSAAGLFFYGSLMALFTGENSTSGHTSGALLFAIPEVVVRGDAGGFDYLLTPSALVYGLGAITAIMSMCLIEQERDSTLTWRIVALVALPALALPQNSVGALYCLGFVGILLFWTRLGERRSWLGIALMLCVFLGAWKIMGFDHSPDASDAAISLPLAREWWPVAVWFLIGLGYRIVGFRWIRRPLKDPVAAMVLASVVGLLSFYVLVHLRDQNEKYSLYFLQSVFSIFAFSRLTFGFWRNADRAYLMNEWNRPAAKGMIVFAAVGVLLCGFTVASHSHTGIAYFKMKLVVSILVLLLLSAIPALMRRNGKFPAAASALLVGVLTFGFLAWIPEWLWSGMDTLKHDVTYAPGEAQGLRRLGQLMAPTERFATNRHALDVKGNLPPIERSYGYSALSERQVLLEGYMSRGESKLPWFQPLLHDNDAMFTTTDPETLRDSAKKWQVRWLVARPGTDIALPRPLPAWLVEQRDSGDLKIYRID